MKSGKIVLTVDLPTDLIFEFLQHIRDFDTRHSNEVHIQIAGVFSALTADEMLAIFKRIKPPFAHQWQIKPS